MSSSSVSASASAASAASATVEDAQANTERSHRLLNAWRAKNPDDLDDVVSSDWTNHDPAWPFPNLRGPAAAKAALRLCATAFPDLEVVIEDTFGRGDKVVTRWISEGTQTGELPGVPATGRRFRVPGITVDRHEAGRLAESWSAWDILGLFRQLGVAPPMGAVPDALDTAVRETYAVALGIGPEHLGLDSDLEAELGVDSLRHAEIITQLVARIGRDEDAALFEALRQQRTLGRVLDTLRRLTQASSQAPGQDR